jgi:hypothetical protein
MRDYEPEFYIQQNQKMELRFIAVFKKWRLGHKKLFTKIKERLDGSPYWLWQFWLGFGTTLNEAVHLERPLRRKYIWISSRKRFPRIVGSFYKDREYVKSLR